MRDCMIWTIVLVAIAGTAYSEAPKPAEQGKALQEAGTGGKTQSPPKELTVDLGGGVKMEMVLIPAGEFKMGDDKGANDEKPVHKVRITKPFYLGKYEVTQEQWKAVMGDNPSRFKGPKNPAEMVGWAECQEFLKRLNKKAGGGEFQLPTEAQWEYACRAGSRTSYFYGDDESKLGEYAWHRENSGGKTHQVGEKKPNSWGLYDMHGNVWEWCADWHAERYYAQSPADDPVGPATGSNRVFRGGGWFDTAWGCRSSARFSIGPVFGISARGLRVSRVPADK